MQKHWEQFSPLLFMGVIALLVVGVVYYAFSLLSPSVDLSRDDPESIAKYKEWIKYNDAPLAGGKIKPEELPGMYRKVIEFDVKAGNLKSARELINETIQKKLDAQVLPLVQHQETRDLFSHVQNAQRKVAGLKDFVAVVQKKASDAELARLADEFRKVPFDPAACPEQAAEIASLYRAHLLPLKDKDQRVKKVAEEVEKKCLPPPEPGKK